MRDTDKLLVWACVVVISIPTIYLIVRSRERHTTQVSLKESVTQRESRSQVRPAATSSSGVPASSEYGNSARVGHSSLYPPSNTSGSVDPRVTQDNIFSTICVSGYTRSVRPPHKVSEHIKERLMSQLQLPGDVSDYQLDHVVPLELGGCPDCLSNLWMEPYADAIRKDHVERFLHSEVCSGKITLQAAQSAIMQDWVAVYRQRYGTP